MKQTKSETRLQILLTRSCRPSSKICCCLVVLLFFVTNNAIANNFVIISPVLSAARESQKKLFLHRRLYFSGGADDVPAEQDNANLEDTNSKRPMPRSRLSAPFLMNEAAKEEASVSMDDSVSEDDLSEEEEGETRSKLVGGALVNEIQTHDSVHPTYKSVGAPMAARLLADEYTEGIDEVSTSEKRLEKNATDLAKLWWVNVWTQQLSEAPTDDMASTNLTSLVDDSSEETESQNDEVTEDSFETDTVVMKAANEISPSYNETPLGEDEDQADTNIRDASEPELDESSPIIQDQLKDADDLSPVQVETSQYEEVFVSSGMWIPIDNVLTLGLASRYQSLRVSRSLRKSRKLAAKLTGFHGLLSGKPYAVQPNEEIETDKSANESRQHQKRIEAIGKARERVERLSSESTSFRRKSFFRRRRDSEKSIIIDETAQMEDAASDREERLAERERTEIIREERVKEIDRLIAEGQDRLQELICEKDVLQRRPNPLYNYTTGTVENETSNVSVGVQASRHFKFPPDDLVEEYLEMIFWSRRLTKMNHTYLWKDSDIDEDDEDERIGDDLLTPSAEAHKLYQDAERRQKTKRSGRGRNGGGGSWLLRRSIGKGPSLGEKIGEAAETAAYKAVAAAVMSVLARALSSLHGINVMKHTDIRLMLEQAPELPPMGVLPGNSKNYAQEAIKTAIRKRSRKGRKRQKPRLSDDSFVQRDAVTEMLLSHVQISAPLLKLFPLGWQRALLGNIITLSTAVVSDFCEGLQFQILGYRLSFAFKPITEEDMISHLGLAGAGFNHRRAKPEDFEAAVRATAQDISEELKFLDRWHERALGSGVLRTQIANLIARIVLTLTDEVLSGARMDLWSAHAGGPRMIAGLEYRTQPN